MPLFSKLKKLGKGKKDDGYGGASKAAPSKSATDTPPPPKSPHPAPTKPPPPSSSSSSSHRKRGKEKSHTHKSSSREKSSKDKDHSDRRSSRSETSKDRQPTHGGRDTIEIEDTEPKMPVAVGMRRRDSTREDAANDGSSGGGPRDVGLMRKASMKGIKLDANAIEGSVAGNFMHNVYSSPLQATLEYESPVYSKSDKDVEFISVALQRNFVFANALSDEDVIRKKEMKQIVDAFEKHSVADPGVTILSAGRVGDYFYILKEGLVEYKNPEGEVIGKAKRPGQSFGELCLLYDCPPPADCVSGPIGGGNIQCRNGGACLLWRIHKLTFRQIMALRTMRQDQKLREAIRRVDAFRGLDDEFINRIANALDVRTVKKGEVIYRPGDVAEELFVVGSEGRVKLAPADGGKSQTLGSGDAFGEEAMATSSGARRTETATADKKTMLVYMTRSHLDRTIGSLSDALVLSRDRRLLKAVPLFRDSDFEDFEYELLAALIEKVSYRGGGRSSTRRRNTCRSRPS